jgi:membrane-associated protease RseP (regulator of RpoE activity)
MTMRFRGRWLPLVAALALPGALQAQDDDCPCRERRGMIGVVFDTRAGEDGVRVVEVRRGSPADEAGVRQGDVVVRLNGERAAGAVDALPGRLQVGDTVRLRIRRHGGGERDVVVVAQARPATRFSMVRPEIEGRLLGRENLVIINGDSMRIPLQELTVRIDSLRTHLMEIEELGAVRVEVDSLVRMFADSGSVWMQRMPNVEMRITEPRRMNDRVVVEDVVVHGGMPMGEEGRPFFMELGRRSAAGAELAEMNEGLSAYFGGQREGALVIEVSPESPAARAGLQPGDVIVRAGGQDVEDPADVRAALNRAEAGQVALEVIRRGSRRELSLEWTGGAERLFQRELREPARGREPVRVRGREN